MKTNLILFFLLFSVILSAGVANYSNLPEELKESVIPDIEGKVLIDDTYLNNFKAANDNTRELPSVMDGFPVSFTMANCYKGAIYTDMDGDPEMEIIFGAGKKVTALNLDGSSVEGWPVENDYYIWSSPACGDIDGDGIDEIVTTSRNNTTGNEGELYAFEMDGSYCAGFPVTMAGGGTMNACLADLDNDDDMEIFVNVRNSPEGWVYVFNGDGSVVEGWPAALDYVPGASISVGDLDADGDMEVIALSYYSLYVFDHAGTLQPGFPFSQDDITISYSQPVLYDMDGNGDLEILFGACTDAGKVFAVNHDASVVEGWPQDTDYWIFGTVTLGDIDNNGELDVVVGDQVSSGTPVAQLYAWDLSGVPITGFPAGPVSSVYAQVGIADIDGDGSVEIMIDDNRFGYGYDCFNHDGSHCEEWPLACGTVWSSTTMMITPVIGDFDNDGLLNIAGAATDVVGWVVEEYVWSTTVAWDEDLAYSVIDGFNIQHSGLYEEAGEFSPEPPENVNAEVVNYNAILTTWDPPQNAEPLSYLIFLDGELLGVTVETSFQYYDFDEGIYTISVSADYDGEQSEQVICDPVEVFFDYPANLTYEVVTGPEVALYWEFPVSRGLDGFAVYRDNILISVTELLEYTDAEVDDDLTYQYFVTAVYSEIYESEATNTVEVHVTDSDDDLPDLETKLLGNYPNPFNPSTTISFNITSMDGSAKLEIYNVLGKRIKVFAFPIGSLGTCDTQNVIWDGIDNEGKTVPSGIYFYRLKTGDHDSIRKMLLMK